MDRQVFFQNYSSYVQSGASSSSYRSCYRSGRIGVTENLCHGAR